MMDLPPAEPPAINIEAEEQASLCAEFGMAGQTVSIIPDPETGTLVYTNIPEAIGNLDTVRFEFSCPSEPFDPYQLVPDEQPDVSYHEPLIG